MTEHTLNVTQYDDVNIEPHYQKQLRILILHWACRAQNTECLEHSNNRLRQYLNNSQSIHQNVRAAILCNGMRNASAEDASQLYEKLYTTEEANERTDIIVGLACTANTSIIDNLLVTSIGSNSEVAYRSIAERYRILSNMMGNGAVGTNASIQFLLSYWPNVVNTFRNNINGGVISIASFVVSEELETEVDFFRFFTVFLIINFLLVQQAFNFSCK